MHIVRHHLKTAGPAAGSWVPAGPSTCSEWMPA
jgi:hypothetical protein